MSTFSTFSLRHTLEVTWEYWVIRSMAVFESSRLDRAGSMANPLLVVAAKSKSSALLGSTLLLWEWGAVLPT